MTPRSRRSGTSDHGRAALAARLTSRHAQRWAVRLTAVCLVLLAVALGVGQES